MQLAGINNISANTEKGLHLTTANLKVKADGKELCTAELQQAIDRVAAQGGGQLTFAPGRYLTGGLMLRSGVELYLEEGATLLGTGDQAYNVMYGPMDFSVIAARVKFVYLNTVYGHEFWRSQPRRYPDKYYEFMSTKFRLNVGMGQRITWDIPRNRRKYAKSISLFYEVSSCDLYIRAKFQDSSIPLKDIVGLSLGLKLQTM